MQHIQPSQRLVGMVSRLQAARGWGVASAVGLLASNSGTLLTSAAWLLMSFPSGFAGSAKAAAGCCRSACQACLGCDCLPDSSQQRGASAIAFDGTPLQPNILHGPADGKQSFSRLVPDDGLCHCHPVALQTAATVRMHTEYVFITARTLSLLGPSHCGEHPCL